MLRLFLSRLWQSALVLLGVTFLTFWLLAGAGGDALVAIGHDPAVPRETADALRKVYGLDQPIIIRYCQWLTGIAKGDFGQSFYFHAPVSDILPLRLSRTLMLTSTALVMAWIVGLSLGILAAIETTWGRFIHRLCQLMTTLAFATPRLVLALCALTFILTLDHSPEILTREESSLTAGNQLLGNLLIAACVLALPLAALFLTHTRESFATTLKEEFVRVARAKGLPERLVVLRHAARAALNPLITLLGLSLGNLLSGSVIVESVLGWSGVGQLSVLAVRSRDIPLLLSIVFVTCTAVLVGNLVCDILIRVNDPR